MTVQDAADILGVFASRVYVMCRDGVLGTIDTCQTGIKVGSESFLELQNGAIRAKAGGGVLMSADGATNKPLAGDARVRGDRCATLQATAPFVQGIMHEKKQRLDEDCLHASDGHDFQIWIYAERIRR